MKTIIFVEHLIYSRNREINDCVVVPFNPMHKKTKEVLTWIDGHLKVFQQKVCQNFKRILNYLNVTECFFKHRDQIKTMIYKYYKVLL